MESNRWKARMAFKGGSVNVNSNAKSNNKWNFERKRLRSAVK